MSVLPLSWLISIWKNFPEFWNQKVPEMISDFGHFEKIPIPRGPFSCDRHVKQLTKGKFFFNNNNNLPRAVSSESKFVYMTKSSFHNPPAILSSLTYLYSSGPMPSSAKEVPRYEIVKQKNNNIINVKEISRSSSHPVQAELAGPPLLYPGALIADPTEGAEKYHQNSEDSSANDVTCQCTEDTVCDSCLRKWLY